MQFSLDFKTQSKHTVMLLHRLQPCSKSDSLRLNLLYLFKEEWKSGSFKKAFLQLKIKIMKPVNQL